MVAPNCIKDKFKPPAGHKSLYCFSPSKIVGECRNKRTMKKVISEPVTARSKRQKKMFYNFKFYFL